VDPKTFYVIDLFNKALIVEKGNSIATQVYEVGKGDGESGKGIYCGIINAAAKLNNALKYQKMKLTKWAMIKEALEAGVPGMQEVAAPFMKREFTYFIRMRNKTDLTFKLFCLLTAVFQCNME
jgi:hypothetical protein